MKFLKKLYLLSFVGVVTTGLNSSISATDSPVTDTPFTDSSEKEYDIRTASSAEDVEQQILRLLDRPTLVLINIDHTLLCATEPCFRPNTLKELGNIKATSLQHLTTRQKRWAHALEYTTTATQLTNRNWPSIISNLQTKALVLGYTSLAMNDLAPLSINTTRWCQKSLQESGIHFSPSETILFLDQSNANQTIGMEDGVLYAGKIKRLNMSDLVQALSTNPERIIAVDCQKQHLKSIATAANEAEISNFTGLHCTEVYCIPPAKPDKEGLEEKFMKIEKQTFKECPVTKEDLQSLVDKFWAKATINAADPP
ncbi:MAG: hypothetical protein RLZ12_635 [Bacillota bacterium]|jgi:hypothetical protein